MAEKISLDVLKNLDDKSVLILLVTQGNELNSAIERLAVHVEAFQKTTEKKLDKEDFFRYRDAIDGSLERWKEKVNKIENQIENADLQKSGEKVRL